MGKVFDALLKESWKKWNPSGFYGVMRDGTISSRIKYVAEHEPDVTVAQLLAFIMPTAKLAIIFSNGALQAIARRAPRGWLRAKGHEMLRTTNVKQLIVAPGWIAHGGGSFKQAAADTDVLFAALARPFAKRRDVVRYPLMFAIVDLIEAAPATAWPKVAARLPTLDGVAYTWLSGRVARLIPKAIAQAKRESSVRRATVLEQLRDEIIQRKRQLR